jgi:hypothetical protein
MYLPKKLRLIAKKGGFSECALKDKNITCLGGMGIEILIFKMDPLTECFSVS